MAQLRSIVLWFGDQSGLHKGAATQVLMQIAAAIAGWLCVVTLYGGFSYIDSARFGADPKLLENLTAYALGFAPWIVLGPTVFWLARRQRELNRNRFMTAFEALMMFAAAFGAIFLYFVAVYAPVQGMSASEAVSHTRLTEWASDVLIFLIAFLAGYGSAHKQKSHSENQARIAVKSQGRVDYVLIDDIIAGASKGNYIAIYTEGGEHLYRGALSSLIEVLAPYGLMRCHRSFFIRPGAIISAVTLGEKLRSVKLNNAMEIPVSNQYEESTKIALAEFVACSG
ncbi:MAG: hypothetical protein DHS20C05_22520 [Hyphococcus sp.]|nr:MAG: hypothetical protein DHS20C05_22520 [Marinicaulis sp.]